MAGTAQPPSSGSGTPGGDDPGAKRAEATARLSELLDKLRDAQTRLDATLAQSRELQDKLRQLRAEEEGSSPNGT